MRSSSLLRLSPGRRGAATNAHKGPAAAAVAIARNFAFRVPKAELHLHIEGTLEPSLLMALSRRNKIPIPFATAKQAREAYRFNNLQSFLDIYYQGAAVLRTQRDFRDLTFAYFKRAHADNVRHAEIFFDPQTHLVRNIPMGTIVGGISQGAALAEAKLGISSHLILSFLRHLPEADGFATLEKALPYLPHQPQDKQQQKTQTASPTPTSSSSRIMAVGLDSSESGNPPIKFTRLFAECRRIGLPAVAHAGEEGPPSYIWQALTRLKAKRIDHGVRCETDARLVAYLKKHRVPLTVCPLSNVALKVIPSIESTNTLRLLRKGLCVTVNSDDPAYFGGYIGENFAQLVDHCGATVEEVGMLARNSFEASWLVQRRRQALIKEVDVMLKATQRKLRSLR